MSRFERLRVKPADFHPSWYHRPAMLLMVIVGGYMTIDGIRELLAGHWYGIYFAVFAGCAVAAARMDVAIQRAQQRDKIAQLEARAWHRREVMTQPDYSWPALIRRAHSLEHAEGWQYAVVWRFAPIEHQHRLAELLSDPPEGNGWEPNVDRAGGAEISKPSWWTEGRHVMHAAYWRRPMPGMVPWMVGSKIHEQRKDD